MNYTTFWTIHQVIVDFLLTMILIAVWTFNKEEATRDKKLLKKENKKTIVIHKKGR